MEAVGDGLDFLNSGRASKTIRGKFTELAEQAVKEFEKTTKGWNHDVDFKIRGSVKETNVYTDDKVYMYLNNGTSMHAVWPSGFGGVMQFKTGYTPKTSAGSLNSNSGGGGTGDFAYSKGHVVSGIEARHFDKAVAEALEEYVKDNSDWFKDL